MLGFLLSKKYVSAFLFVERQYYRLYAIHKMPTLKSLDYNKVNRSERETAARLARSAAGAALESDVQREWYSITNDKDDNTAGGDYNNVKTFIPGEGILSLGDENGTPSKATAFTAEQKQQIRDLLANASSVKEVEEIENSVRKGILPERLMKRSLPSDVDDDNNERDTKIQKIPTATI